MENLGFNLFDTVVIGLILLLSIKGLLSGFTKELFNSLGLLGGLFIASLYKNEIALYIKDNFLNDISMPLLIVISFLAIFISIFIIAKVLYKLISLAFSDDYTSATSRFAGMLIKMITLFFIFAIITFGLSSNPKVFNKLKEYTNQSKLFPILKDTGKFILNPNLENSMLEQNSNESNSTKLNQPIEEKDKNETILKKNDNTIDKNDTIQKDIDYNTTQTSKSSSKVIEDNKTIDTTNESNKSDSNITLKK